MIARLTEFPADKRPSHDELVKMVEAYIADHPGTSWSKVAGHVGIKSGVLSQWRWNKYQGNNEKIENALIEFFERQRHADQDVVYTPVKTWVYEEIDSGLYTADSMRGILICGGDPGIGKSFTAHDYFRRNRTRCLDVQADPSWHSMHGVMVGLYYELSNSYQWTIASPAIRAKLKASDISFIIIHDAHNWTVEAYDWIMSINEACDVGFGLIGHPEMIEQFKQIQFINGSRFARMRDRAFWCDIQRPRTKEGNPLPMFSRDEVGGVAVQHLPTLNDEALDELYKPELGVADSMRRVAKACDIARRIQVLANRRTDALLIREAIKLLTPKPLRSA